jgi:tRNA(Ile)-lysidine synthase TilS/MesJ
MVRDMSVSIKKLRRLFEVIWMTEGHFAGLPFDSIIEILRDEYNLTKDEIEAFGEWLFSKGIREGWIFDELNCKDRTECYMKFKELWKV